MRKMSEEEYPRAPKTYGRLVSWPGYNGHCRYCGKKLPKKEELPDKRFYSFYYCPSNISDCKKKYRHKFRYFNWDLLRWKTLRRDHYQCVKCGCNDLRSLEVDHIVSIGMGGAAFDPDNLQTLCIDCHLEKTKIDMKKISGKPIPRKVIPLMDFLMRE